MMKRIFVSSPNGTHLNIIVQILKTSFTDLDVPIEVNAACTCDEALSLLMDKRFQYDGYIFDSENCNYFSTLLDHTKHHKIRMSFDDLKKNNSHELLSVRSTINKERYFSIDRSFFFLENNKDNIKNILRFLFLSPDFYFSYGNNSTGNNEIGEARDLLLEIEKCLSDVFPNIITKKDFSDFKKGGLLEDSIKSLVSSPYILVIMNDKYFESIHCMKEFYLILESIDYNVAKFNQKILLILSNNIRLCLDPSDIAKHSGFIEKITNYWLEKLEQSYQAFKNSKGTSSIYREQVETQMCVLNKCVPFIRDELHRIIMGDQFNLAKIRANGYPDLMLEINDKLERDGYHTFYSNLKNKDIMIMNKSIRFTNYKQILN